MVGRAPTQLFLARLAIGVIVFHCYVAYDSIPQKNAIRPHAQVGTPATPGEPWGGGEREASQR